MGGPPASHTQEMCEMSKNLRIGCVGYLNALPFYLPFHLGKIQGGGEWVYGVPTQLNALLQNRELDCALTSSVEYLDGNYQLLPGFGIAGEKNIMSVKLYTQLPLSSLNGQRVGVPPQSATATLLLKVLCRHLWNIEPYFEPLQNQKEFAAFLLIGDAALENLSIPGFQALDLSEAWYQLTALPFVFALFFARKEIAPQKIAHLQQQLHAALHWSDSHREIVEKEALKRCPLPPEVIHRYYSLLQHRIGEKEMEGLKMFKKFKDVQTIGP
jgi:chorismate dehydratase